MQIIDFGNFGTPSRIDYRIVYRIDYSMKALINKLQL